MIWKVEQDSNGYRILSERGELRGRYAADALTLVTNLAFALEECDRLHTETRAQQRQLDSWREAWERAAKDIHHWAQSAMSTARWMGAKEAAYAARQRQGDENLTAAYMAGQAAQADADRAVVERLKAAIRDCRTELWEEYERTSIVGQASKSTFDAMTERIINGGTAAGESDD